MDKFRYSTNPDITSSMDKNRAASKTIGWELREIPFTYLDLTNMVRTEAYVTSKLAEGGKKDRQSVEEVYFAALDFDNKLDPNNPSKPYKLTIEEFIQRVDDLKLKISYFLHTTRSHSKTTDKFRVLIPFSRPITGAEYLSTLSTWVKLFPEIDTTCIQPERFFHIAPEAETYISVLLNNTGIVITGNKDLELPEGDFPKFLDPVSIINQVAVAEVAIQGKQANDLKEPLINKHDSQYISGNTKVKTSSGVTIELNSLTEEQGRIDIFCPICIHDSKHRGNPNNHNAFAIRQQNGRIYVFCNSANKGFKQYPDEIKIKHPNLFFSTQGYPCTIENGKPRFFNKTVDDWENWCSTYDLSPDIKKALIRRTVIFNPSMKSGNIDGEGPEGKLYNFFQESPLLKNTSALENKIPHSEIKPYLKEKCPTINLMLENFLGDEDIVLQQFINWLAFILQLRKKAFSAWLIITEKGGAGKGIFYDRVLVPLFGKHQTAQEKGAAMGGAFNAEMFGLWLMNYDEVFQKGATEKNNERKEWLKSNITSKEFYIQPKGIDKVYTQNHINYILFSNNDSPILLDKDDRRFFVVKNLHARHLNTYPEWPETENERFVLIDKDLEAFTALIKSVEVDEKATEKPIQTEIRKSIQEKSQDDYHNFVEALKEKDADWFDLETIYDLQDPSNKSTFNSDGHYVHDLIKIHGCIPTFIMDKMVSKIFGGKSYKFHIKQLRSLGLTSKVRNNPYPLKTNTKTIRVWEII